jgi:hypothetical protein
MVDNVRAVPRYRHDRDEVDERDTTSPVVYQRGLALLARVEHPLQVRHGDVVGVFSFRAFDNFALGACYGKTQFGHGAKTHSEGTDSCAPGPAIVRSPSER